MNSTASDSHPALERARRIAGEAVLAALIVASGRLKIIPNVEWVSVLVLAAGMLLGPWAGIRVAVLGELLYSLTSPYGLAPPLVLLSQTVGMAPAGIAGGLLGQRKCPFWAFGACGLVTTLWFDLCTNLASAPFVGGIKPALLMAIPFSAVHVASNVLFFSAVGPALGARLWPRPAA